MSSVYSSQSEDNTSNPQPDLFQSKTEENNVHANKNILTQKSRENNTPNIHVHPTQLTDDILSQLTQKLNNDMSGNNNLSGNNDMRGNNNMRGNNDIRDNNGMRGNNDMHENTSLQSTTSVSGISNDGNMLPEVDPPQGTYILQHGGYMYKVEKIEKINDQQIKEPSGLIQLPSIQSSISHEAPM